MLALIELWIYLSLKILSGAVTNSNQQLQSGKEIVVDPRDRKRSKIILNDKDQTAVKIEMTRI